MAKGTEPSNIDEWIEANGSRPTNPDELHEAFRQYIEAMMLAEVSDMQKYGS